ncbi:MAG TPA: deoxyribose-phosphate aldolase [Lachnospiraceae bacterium]|nr:deoxyribose-phosphate aldolase [Lachnospiraceae bacterium]
MVGLKEHGYDPAYAQYCDHTVLRAYTKRETVIEFCEEAKKYGAASVCVNPCNVRLVHDCLAGTGVKTSTVVGFPLGANKTEIKAAETAAAIADGADEIDMVINIGAVKSGDWDYVQRDIAAVVKAADKKALVKVIIETCYLTRDEKIRVTETAIRAGADFIKTSTGMGTDGATAEDVRLLTGIAAGRARVKASGNVACRKEAYEMIMAGADRLGISRLLQIVNDDTSLSSAATKNKPL